MTSSRAAGVSVIAVPLALSAFGAVALSRGLPGWTSAVAVVVAAFLAELLVDRASRPRRWIDVCAVRSVPAVPALGAAFGIGGGIGASTAAAIALAMGLAWLVATTARETHRALVVPAALLGLAAAAGAIGPQIVGSGRSVTPFLLGAFAAAACSAARWSPPTAFEGLPGAGGSERARIALALDVVLAIASAIAGGASGSGLVLLACFVASEAVVGMLRAEGDWSRRASFVAFAAPAFGAWLVTSALPRTWFGAPIAIGGALAVVLGAGWLAVRAMDRSRQVSPATRAGLLIGSIAIPLALVLAAMRLETWLRIDSSEWRRVAPGVEVMVDFLDAKAGVDGSPVRAVVVRVDLASPAIELFATPIAFPKPMDPFELRYVAEVAASEDLAVATNGPLFGGSFGSLPLPGLPYRTTEAMVIDGRPVCVTPITYLFWTDADRRLHVERSKPPSTEALAGAVWGVGVQQVHLRDGVIPGYYREGSHERYELTLIGSDAQGRFLSLSRFDAVDPVAALDFVAGLGVVHAGELDGGSASAIAVRGAEGLRVAGGTRPVAVTIGVRSRAASGRRDSAEKSGIGGARSP